MQLTQPTADLYVPDGAAEAAACARISHLGIAAHQDDLEIMAYHGILAGFQRADAWFAGVVVTNGSGSPRDELYAGYTDAEMMRVRRREQRKAADVGDYGALAALDFSSAQTKAPDEPAVVQDLLTLLTAMRPQVVYTHNLADKHDTHVAVAVRVLTALRRLPAEARPAKVYGCEVWRDLDWLGDDEKVALDVSGHENLAAALLGVFDSQICGGKRYDLATLGRRRAHATYHASHAVDVATGLTFAMDLTPLLTDPTQEIGAFVQERITRFAADVAARVQKVLPPA
jgi:LmbE family N-acetylglucosaminyl deacetylase